MNDTTFQGNGKIAYVPVVVNAKPPKPTNADRIRSMTDEELAVWIAEYTDCLCGIHKPGCSKTKGTCVATWLDWLKQEAGDAD